MNEQEIVQELSYYQISDLNNTEEKIGQANRDVQLSDQFIFYKKTKKYYPIQPLSYVQDLIKDYEVNYVMNYGFYLSLYKVIKGNDIQHVAVQILDPFKPETINNFFCSPFISDKVFITKRNHFEFWKSSYIKYTFYKHLN